MYSKWFLVAIVIVIAITALFILLIQPFLTLLPTNSFAWKIYADPDGYFTIKIPATWQANLNPGYVHSSSNNLQVNYATETIILRPPGPGYPFPFVQIYVDKHSFPCNKNDRPNTTLAGLPASNFLGISHVITTRASYQVSYRLIAEKRGPVPPARALEHEVVLIMSNLPASLWITINPHLIDTILSTFHPIPATPGC